MSCRRPAEHTCQRPTSSFIGFRVATPLLERAFRETYGLEMRDVFADMDRSISTYRYSVSQLIPALTEAAWRDKHDEILKLHPSLGNTGFVFAYGRQAFEREYGSDYERPGWFARLIAWIYRIIPKFGPLKPLSFKTPTPQADALFAGSFRDSSTSLRTKLRQVADGHLELANTNFDTGRHSRHGEYKLADDTYAEWMSRLAKQKFEGVTAPIRANVAGFYGDRPQPSSLSRHDRRHWTRVMSDFDLLMKSGSEG